MGCGTCTSKTAVGAVGLAYLVLSITLITVSCFVLVSYGHLDAEFLKHTFTMIPGAALLTFGLLFGLAALIACCAAINHNKCLLALFLGVTGVLTAAVAIILAFFAIHGSFITSEQIKTEMTDTLKNLYSHSPDASVAQNATTSEIDFWQNQIECCGVESYRDFWTVGAMPQGEIPASCCNATVVDAKCPEKMDVSFNNTKWAWTQGCVTKIEESIVSYNAYIKIALAVALSVLLLGIGGAMVLCCVKRREPQPTYSTLVN